MRGEHAHRACEQILICLRGSVRCMVDDGGTRTEFMLDRPDVGLHVPALRWGTQYRYSQDAVLPSSRRCRTTRTTTSADYEEFLLAVRPSR